MTRVRPGDAAGERLARARMLGALFGHERAGDFGRFHVLRRLGAGGMGVVYEAYDPDLARGVALKLVDVAHRDRDAALAEAKMLARLSHPNVVPIYDVGLDGDHVYLVMELVRGRALDQWPAPTRSGILAAYQQAGAALAAAHRAGVVHRDFKPANAIIGDDGRVRVLDFGLACEADAPDDPAPRRGAAGTKGFMAPEIAARAGVTPAADQYSFCVALAATLELTREPVPRWIAAALDRGRAAAPADRFASMDQLLRALARDPARTRRRATIAGAAVLAIGATAFVVGQRTMTPASLAICDEARAEIEAAWPAAARGAALDHVAGLTGEGAATRARLASRVERYMESWADERRAACRDRLSGQSPEDHSDRRQACLRRGRRALEDIGEALAKATNQTLPTLQTAVVSIADPSRCADEALSSATVEVPPAARAPAIDDVKRRVEHARTQIDVGNYARAEAEASAALLHARALGFRPLLAQALLTSGHALIENKHALASVPVLREATVTAIQANMDPVAIEALARQVYAQGIQVRPGDALANLDLVLAVAVRTPSNFAQALLYNNLGTVALATDDRDTARAHFTTALSLASTVDGHQAGGLELLAVRANLGLVTDDRAQGDKLMQETERELAQLLGEHHPRTMTVRWMRGTNTIEALPEAVALLASLCADYEHYPESDVRTARCWVELGSSYLDLERREDARDAFARASRTPKPPSWTGPYQSLFRDADPVRAAREFSREIAAIATPPGGAEPWWTRLSRAELTLGLGRALRAQGKLPEARAALHDAESAFLAIIAKHPDTRHYRLLGRARVEQALVLAALHAPAQDTEATARAAVAWLRRVQGSPSRIAELSTLIGQSARPVTR